MRVLLEAAKLDRGLAELAQQIATACGGLHGLVVVGVRRGGVPVAERLLEHLQTLDPSGVPKLGTVDVTLHRDDASQALPNPRIGPSDIPCGVDGRVVLLTDDVISTGRTVRAALDAVLDFGRPRRIELATVVDRGGRELPIQPDHCLLRAHVEENERVDVVRGPTGLQAVADAQEQPTEVGGSTVPGGGPA